MPEEKKPAAASASSSQGSQGSSESIGGQGGGAGSNSGGGSEQRAERPAWLPESYYDAEKGPDYDRFGKDHNDLLAFRSEQEVRLNSLPDKPEAYQVALPSDFKPPEGVKFEVDDKDPLLGDLRQIAFDDKLGQDTVTKLYGLYAKARVGEAAAINESYTAEVAKLGDKGPARVDSLITWMRAKTGKDQPALAKMLVTAEMVEEFEKIVASPSRGNFNGSGRDSEQPDKIPGYDKMSFSERMNAVRARKSA